MKIGVRILFVLLVLILAPLSALAGENSIVEYASV